MIKTKIRTQFLRLFLIIGLIPLILISFLIYFQSSNNLLNMSFGNMESIQAIRSSDLEGEIKHRFAEFESLSAGEIVKELTLAIQENTLDSRLKKLDSYFGSFIQTNSFYNIMYLSSYNSEILYSFKEEKGYYGDSGLARAWDKAMSSETTIIEDFSEYKPSGSIQAAFLAKKIRDTDGRPVGVLILQLTDLFVESILKSRTGMGQTGESYLITYNIKSNSYEFRSNLLSMKNGEYKIGYSWKGEPLSYWSDAVNSGVYGGKGIYRDSENQKVLVVFNKIDMPLLNWYLISKIDKSEVVSSLNTLVFNSIFLLLFILIVISVLSISFSKKMTEPIIKGANFAESIANGEFDQKLDIHRTDELGVLAKSLKDMGRKLKEQSWIRSGKEGLDDVVRGEHDVTELGRKSISFIAKHLDAQIGLFYVLKGDEFLHLTSSYAFSDRKGNFNKVAIGEGLVGQAALEKNEIVYTHVPTDSPEFNYGVSSVLPTCYIATPLIFEDELLGVILIGISVPVTKLQRAFITSVKDNIAILMNSARSSTVIQSLLEDAQNKQEELRVTNEELEQQTIALKDSEKDLQAQQEELRVTNEELEERTEALEKQRIIMKDKNRELEVIRKDLELKAEDLEKASKYKSEFLANMSHELRTPLNSILILSQLISNNKKGNLDEKQVKSANAIYSSGEDLLRLINEILDLSKVEAGKIEIAPEVVTIDSIIEDLDRVYRPSAEQKGIDLEFIKNSSVPLSIITDPHRLQQVLKNLLTNAFKFTEKGGKITFSVKSDSNSIKFSIKDTGIGIPKDKQNAIFEAFQQADGSTSRKYGGTGLGLSISRELMKLLDGHIKLESEEGKGSTFTVTLNLKEGSTFSVKKNQESDELPEVNKVGEIHVKDDRESVETGSNTLLIIEDDVNFAAILKEQAHERGFKVLIAEDGETGLHFADYYKPSGIILDIGLPGIDGWAVMNRIKNDPELRHIPVHFMSGKDESLEAMKMGAIGYMLKPVTLDGIKDAFEKIEHSIADGLNKLLIIEDDQIQRESIEELISGNDVEVTGVRTGKEAYNLMISKKFDCIILDLGLEDMSGYDLLDKIKNNENIASTPIIIYTGRDLTSEQEIRLNKYAESIIIKGAKSPERLLEESSLFLHRINSNLSGLQKETLEKINRREDVLPGKNILVVDDDMRNIFALSNILEEKDMNVIIARDGQESVSIVRNTPDIDLILMDIMMPKMDGYEAMKEIRKVASKDSLPIIALTANAMKGDRNKCIDAGANDYLAKPVDNNKLISMLRVWLYK